MEDVTASGVGQNLGTFWQTGFIGVCCPKMSEPHVLADLFGLLFVGLLVKLVWNMFAEPRRGEVRRHEPSRSQYGSHNRRSYNDSNYDFQREIRISYSNPHNNHDHNKRMHATRCEAESMVDRMRRSGVPDSERLNVYYNKQRNGWFVGRSSWY